MSERSATVNPSTKTMLDVVNFVRLVEKYPCIYNNTLPEYSNRAKTKRAWEHIARTFDCEEHECKEKWRKIRIAFMRSLKQMKGSAIRPYYLYDYLTFLIPFIKTNDEPANQASSPVSEDQDDHDHLEMDIKNDKATPDSEEEEESSFQNQNGDLSNHKSHSIFFNDRQSTYDSERQVEDRKRRRTENIEDNPRKMFLLSLLPDIEAFTDDEMRIFRRGIITCIDNVMDARKRQI